MGNQAKTKVNETSRITLTVNGQVYELEVGSKPDQVEPSHTLAHTLRETLNLTGTKVSCNHGACGCCTLLMDGKAVLSCMTLTVECDRKRITSIDQNMAEKAAEQAVAGAKPLSMNTYKIEITKALVKRAILNTPVSPIVE